MGNAEILLIANNILHVTHAPSKGIGTTINNVDGAIQILLALVVV